MTDFTITEDFPKSEIEFDQRFSDPKACYDYLFRQKWPTGFICKKCGHSNKVTYSEIVWDVDPISEYFAT